MLARKKLSVGRFTVPYRVLGESFEDTVVLLNGLGSTLVAYKAMAKALAEHRRVVVFNFPGQGQQATIESGANKVGAADQLAILEAIVDNLAGQGRLHLFGASWGGVQAAAFASEHPGRVTSLVLCCVSLTMSAQAQDGLRIIREAYPRRDFSSLKNALTEWFHDFPKDHLVMMEGQYRDATQLEMEVLYNHALDLVTPRSLHHRVLPEQIECPTLLVAGELDRIALPEHVESLHARMPHSQLHVMAGLGHIGAMLEPQTLALSVQHFERAETGG